MKCIRVGNVWIDFWLCGGLMIFVLVEENEEKSCNEVKIMLSTGTQHCIEKTDNFCSVLLHYYNYKTCTFFYYYTVPVPVQVGTRY